MAIDLLLNPARLVNHFANGYVSIYTPSPGGTGLSGRPARLAFHPATGWITLSQSNGHAYTTPHGITVSAAISEANVPVIDELDITVISQYANSPILLYLVRSFFENLNQAPIFREFYHDIWNIDTANSYGLNIWGRIVGISRYLRFDDNPYFGFDTGFQPFNQAPFFDGSDASNTFKLDDDAFRQLIYAKAYSNITGCSIPELNKMLSILFDGRPCHVEDFGNMAMAYTFDFELSVIDRAIIYNSGVIPHPAGVRVLIYEASWPAFGFSEAGEPPDVLPFSDYP